MLGSLAELLVLILLLFLLILLLLIIRLLGLVELMLLLLWLEHQLLSSGFPVDLKLGGRRPRVGGRRRIVLHRAVPNRMNELMMTELATHFLLRGQLKMLNAEIITTVQLLIDKVLRTTHYINAPTPESTRTKSTYWYSYK